MAAGVAGEGSPTTTPTPWGGGSDPEERPGCTAAAVRAAWRCAAPLGGEGGWEPRNIKSEICHDWAEINGALGMGLYKSHLRIIRWELELLVTARAGVPR